MKRIILVGSILVSLALPANAITIKGAGARSCGTWLEERNSRFGWADTGQWTLGYLSATAVYGPSGIDPLKDLDPNAVFYWLDNYCRSNPTHALNVALAAFTWRNGQ